MKHEITRDIIILSQPSEDANEDDREAAYNLIAALYDYKNECVGLAANMIGISKRIIAFFLPDGDHMVMLNPRIIEYKGEYETTEGCLSLDGLRPTKRWKRIKVEFQSLDMKLQRRTFSDFTAEVIQHEIDHCNGILI